MKKRQSLELVAVNSARTCARNWAKSWDTYLEELDRVLVLWLGVRS